jgi:beta-lactamase regulating signal transducer with metallopeptidase domain
MLNLPPSLLETLGWTLIHSLWQGALVATLLFFVLLFVKQSQLRYVISCAALALMILFPLVTFGILFDKPNPTIQTNVAPDVLPTFQPLDVDEAAKVDTLQTLPRVGQPHGVAPTTSWNERSWRQWLTKYLPYAVLAWLLGVVLLSLRLLLQWVYAERFKRRHTKHASADVQHLVWVLALRLCVSRPVQVLESSLADAPTVIGFLKPVILLPTSALTGLTMGQLEALLAHELAHIRRHDYLVNILQSVVETLLFYHPAVWWVSQRIRIEREHCCDDVAVGVVGSPVVYAKALATLETLRSQPQLALAASDGKLVNRMRRVLGISEKECHPFDWIAGGLILVAAITLTVVSLPESRAQENIGKEIYLTVVADFTVSEDSNDGSITLEGVLDGKSFAILEERTSAQKQAALLGFNDLTALLFEGVFDIKPNELSLDLQSQSTPDADFFTLAYALNPVFSYENQTAPSLTADEVRTVHDGTLEPWLTDAAKGVGKHYLELATENLPLNGVTGTLEDGTTYSILIVKNRDNFAQNLSTFENKDLHQQLLEQAFIYGVIPYDEYLTLLKTLSMNEPGLEQLSTLATNELKLQRLLELAPELPASASSYSLYMKQAASLPDEMDQAAIRELTDLLYAQVRTASVRGTGEGTAINYNESSLVVTSKDAVAIVDFFDPFDYSRSSNELRGVAYRYRALEKGGQEQTGEGIVYENYQSVPSGEPDEFNVITSLGGNMLWVNAGPITFEWSYGSDLGGWVYVDNLNPMVENENSFEDFNLQTILGDTGLEHPLSFTPPLDNAEVVTSFGEQGNFAALRASSTEAPVKAMEDGVVLNASRLSWNDGYIISIEHANGLITAYTNLQSKNLPQESQNVKQGDVIGYLGGGAIFPKDVLKLYVRNAPGQFLDPLQLLPELPISSESN